jgi:ABC-type uncharacterized transport system ATPase subunit
MGEFVMNFLEIQGLTKSFDGFVANKDIDFEMPEGQVHCFIGPNGAGKTTFLSMISGHLKPSSGSISYMGENINKVDVAERARLGIARKFQTPSVFDSISLYENLELAVMMTSRKGRERIERIHEVAESIRLQDLLSAQVSSLSHGQRQWLEIGLLLGMDARLLLLDEPTAGMTAQETRLTGELIRDLADSLTLSTIIIEHDIKFIRELQSPVTVLHLGSVLARGSFEDISNNEDVRRVYIGGK